MEVFSPDLQIGENMASYLSTLLTELFATNLGIISGMGSDNRDFFLLFWEGALGSFRLGKLVCKPLNWEYLL